MKKVKVKNIRTLQHADDETFQNNIFYKQIVKLKAYINATYYGMP